MSTCAPSKISPSPVRQLIRRHFRQIIHRSQEQHDELRSVFAITYLPGNRTNNFLNQALRPLGMAALVCLSYGGDEHGTARSMPIRGVKAELSADGTVSYCAHQSALFLHDAARAPSSKSRNLPLNPGRNLSLTSLAQRVDRACERQLRRVSRLPSVPMLPRIWLGFPPASPPTFEDTPALRELAARELNRPVDQLGANGEGLLQRYLHDLWERQIRWPNADPANPTASLLIDAELCTQARTALRAYEDFSELLGVASWNPARKSAPQFLTNPAKPILERFGIHDLDQPISDQLLAELESAVRQAVPDVPLTQEEVYDAIADHELPLRAWWPALPRLRSLLEPWINECTSDEDLLCAAANPNEPLVASGACRIQVLQRDTDNDRVAFSFPSDELGRRAQVNLHLAKWQPRQPG
jgi:hypothetical protein